MNAQLMVEPGAGQVLVDVVDELLRYTPLQSILPALNRLREQACALARGEQWLSPIERQHVELGAREAQALLSIVARIPPLDRLFGSQPSEAARWAFANFVSNVHACVIGSVFRRHPDLVLERVVARSA